MHNQIQVRSLKKYSAEIFTDALKTVPFPNYNIFLNVNVAYSDLLNKISGTIDSVAPIKYDGITNFEDKKNANIFKEIFCALADKLLANLLPPSLRFGLNSVRQYCKKVLKYPKSKFKFNAVSEENVLKLLQDWDENKAAGLNNISGKFLKNGATVLAKPISQIYNLSIKYSIFPSRCKIKTTI